MAASFVKQGEENDQYCECVHESKLLAKVPKQYDSLAITNIELSYLRSDRAKGRQLHWKAPVV